MPTYTIVMKSNAGQALPVRFFQAGSDATAKAEASTAIADWSELFHPDAQAELRRDDGAVFELGTVKQVSTK